MRHYIANIFNKLPMLLFFLFIFCILSVFYLGISLSLPYNSDHAAILLEAKSIIDGNYLLSGWTLSTVSYYTTEIPFYIIGILLIGFSEKVIYLVSAINYSMLVTLIIYLSSFQSKKLSLKRFFISSCLSLFIASLFSLWSLHSPVHIVAFIYCLSTVPFINRFLMAGKVKDLIPFSLLLLVSFIGDNFAIYIWGIPVILVFLIKLVREKEKSKFFILLITTLIPIFLSSIFLRTISSKGGFILPGVVDEVRFVDYLDLGNNLYLFILGLFDLFSVNFFGKPVLSVESILGSIRIIGLFYFVFIMIMNIKNFFKLPIVNQILVVATLINILEYLLGNVSVNRATVRYLMPSLIFAVILFTSSLTENEWSPKRMVYVIFACGMVGISLLPKISYSRPPLPVANLVSFLHEQKLANGYGPYWSASIATAHSGGKVNIRPVISEDGKYIKPYKWLSEDKWYLEDAHFLVVDGQKSDNVYVDIYAEMARNTFGHPDETYKLDNFTVMIWKNNISADLFTAH